LSVRKSNGWNREEFFAWLDRAIAEAQPPIPDMAALAALSGISHSTLSTWRSGKYRPTQDKLTLIANVLKKPRRDVWLMAGLVDAADVGGPAIRDDHEPTAEDRRAIQMIRDSKLSEPAKKMLIERYLEKVRRAERELREDLRVFEQN
jgi:transcriptional regulator with XRE-family HTH domain